MRVTGVREIAKVRQRRREVRLRRRAKQLRSYSGADQLREFQLRDALDDVQPRAAQVITVGVSDRDEGLNGIDVLRFHLGDGRIGRQQSESRQCLHVGVALEGHVKDTSDTNGASETSSNYERRSDLGAAILFSQIKSLLT